MTALKRLPLVELVAMTACYKLFPVSYLFEKSSNNHLNKTSIGVSNLWYDGNGMGREVAFLGSLDCLWFLAFSIRFGNRRGQLHSAGLKGIL